MTIDLTNRVAIVTGAGGGLGREHALALAKRGAKVVVNDLGGAVDGTGGSLAAAERVAKEIREAGGEAIANSASVTDFDEVEAMVAEATERWGRVDILVANAGILRDKTFAKMEIADFRAVLNVHVMGAVHCAKAVWAGMRERSYGRIVFTTSSSGLFGSFGQANYSAAKMALVGLMNTLALEGAKYDIRVNCLAPTAGTRMLEGLIPDDWLAALDPALVSPAVVALASADAPTKTVLCAGAGGFETARTLLTRGDYFGSREDLPEQVLASLDRLSDLDGVIDPTDGTVQYKHELAKAGFKPREN
ncbi:SDR family NAD(P)-dependent oxidoreductase [Jiella pacifica]|uniref:SDR family NAD(P)-dependent oxidoreductase n=1 Tax=Jiella pacifica TaxID=2696469 RepID=A0A6N9TAU8_9HYPH|nr:SDR family NAD(P)-dependent oxidoreductase [Jiella pacifica]NDW07345.1 SDR family NAD(P)-dependent oxidoreductase [Jiella pacifica]